MSPSYSLTKTLYYVTVLLTSNGEISIFFDIYGLPERTFINFSAFRPDVNVSRAHAH